MLLPLQGFKPSITRNSSKFYVAFDWEVRISDLQSNVKTENRFLLQENHPQGGFQPRNPNRDFMDFLFTVQLGNPKKDCKTILINRGLLFANYVHAQDSCS